MANNIENGSLAAEIALVISNLPDAAGIEIAKRRGLKTLVISSAGKKREAHEAEVIAALQAANVDLICLAGYMRLLSADFVRAFPQRILNIHPSLLPAFPGLHAQKQALEYGVKVAGCTVHFVDEDCDHGPIIVQRSVPVLRDDTEETLAARILEQEHVAYTEAIKKVLSGKFRIVNRCVVVD
jgi:phosphoribosylglycinamide formyltransferase-1